MYQPGDIVRLINGHCPIITTKVTHNDYMLSGFYLSSTTDIGPRYVQDFVPYEKELDHGHIEVLREYQRNYGVWGFPQHLTANPIIQKGNTVMTTLYETNEKPARFGTELAKNSKGEIVIEIKGTGEVVAFKPEDLSEVVPYTVQVDILGGSNPRGVRTYVTQPGSVAVGDLILIDGTKGFGQVVRIDTKERAATAELKGRKISTEDISSD